VATYYAYIITVTCRPEALDEVVRRYQERTVPLTAAAPGLVTLLALVRRATGRAIVIRLWQTPADRARSDTPSTAILEDFTAYAPFLTGPYTRDPYDVHASALPPADPSAPFARMMARVSVVELDQDVWDGEIAPWRDVAGRASADPSTLTGSVLLENRGIGRAVLVELAPSTREFETRWDLASRTRVLPELYEVIARV
jgi:hypothetical protein